MHPLTMITAVVWITSLSLLIDNLWVLGIILVICVMLAVLLSDDNGLSLWYRMRKLTPLFISVFVLQVLFRKGGAVLIDTLLFQVRSLGLYYGVQICLRFAIIICSASTMIRMSYNDFRIAFSTIHLPEEIAFMVSYIIHFVPVLEERFRLSLTTVRRRGVNIGKLHYKEKLHLYKTITVAVLASVLSKTGMQAIALELRGFRSEGKPTQYFQKRIGLKDSLVFYALILLSLIILGTRQSYL